MSDPRNRRLEAVTLFGMIAIVALILLFSLGVLSDTAQSRYFPWGR